LTVSAVSGDGLADVWDAVSTLVAWRRETGVWTSTRTDQARHWFHEEMRAEILARIAADSPTQVRMAQAEADVVAGRLSPAAAAALVLDPIFKRK
jgi:LAO/AO transport system kinase